MTLVDLIDTSIGNLRRMKLRTTLTVSGVVIAVATFVAMLSFGAGNQAYVSEQFEKLGLLHTMQAFPIVQKDASDTTKTRLLDQQAIAAISGLPGVRLVFPFDAFNATVACGDTQVTVRAQAVSQEALRTKWFAGLAAGKAFASDSSKAALVTMRFLEEFEIAEPDSAIGKLIVLSVRRSTIDSGIAQLIPPDRDYIRKRVSEIKFDSLLTRAYVQTLAKTELNHALSQFLDGVMNHREMVIESLVIEGVLQAGGPRERFTSPLFIPTASAKKLSAGFSFDDPTAMMGALTSGNIFSTEETNNSKSFSKVTIDVEPAADQKLIKDSLEGMGFRSFSFADQFEEIKQFFLFFDLGLAVVGLIALVTASLGIINTLVMSVLERRREIGVMKSLGADERDIRNLFLTESGLIGFAGSAIGLLLGWMASRVVSEIAKAYMKSEGLSPIELFAMPIWLILAALALGTTVSILAGLYPASRAARVDPVEALRAD